MSGSWTTRPHRARGSWLPRLAGLGVVVVLAAGSLAVYLGAHHPVPLRMHPHQHAALSSKVVKAQTVGVIDFGPDDDGDAFQDDPDDHPLMLLPTRRGLWFVTISRAELHDGTPLWTANQMADGSEIFIYEPNGKCLSSASPGQVALARCDLSRSQRWRPLNAATTLGQAVSAYASTETGQCLTAPPAPAENHPADPGPASVAPCGRARDKTQEIAFWWGG
jgi:hypothetical protein